MALFPEYDEMLSELFQLLSPEKMGSAYAGALAANDTAALIRTAAAHFRSREEHSYCKEIDLSSCSRETADRACQGDVTIVNVPWHFPGGKIDWFFNPTLETPPVNHEWLWQLNRMNFWRDMCAAYQETGDEKYAKAFNDQLYSWIAGAGTYGEEWNAPGSVWRTIETGLRMMYSWALTFEIFRHSPHFTDENICLMVSSMYRHALHLQKNHRPRNNWLLMEMSGLYTFGALFQEFSCAAEMRHYASQKFSEAAMFQILPDGMHDELSPDYHSVLLSCAFAFCRIAQCEKIQSELPEEFMEKLELSFESALKMATPSLTSPRTNDCFTIPVSSKMKRAHLLFPGRKDFLWGATNRKEGEEPAFPEGCSALLPWAGFAVMRSGWGDDAAYCCFDGGALGMGHMHQDKLNINIFKGADELIYDDGGGQYEQSCHRAYGVNSSSHNTVLVDGLLQRRSAPRKLETPEGMHWVSNENFDYAKSSYEDEYGPLVLCGADLEVPLTKPAVHTREVRFYKPDFFCVKDTLNSLDGAPHTYEMRLHMDTLKVDSYPRHEKGFLSDFGSTYDILVLPLFPEEVETALLSGVDTPPMGGWFVGRNDRDLHKSTTLTMIIAGKRDCTFATLLIPVKRSEEMPEIKKRSAQIFTLRMKDKEYLIDLDNLSK